MSPAGLKLRVRSAGVAVGFVELRGNCEVE